MNLTTSRTPLLGLGVAVLLTATACAGQSSTPVVDGGASSTPSPSTTTSAGASTTPAGSNHAPRLITYAGGESAGVEVHQSSDTKDLRGAPRTFRTFIGQTAQALRSSATCDEAAVGVTVQAIRTDGYAIGGVSECGGYAALWAVVDGDWQEIAGTQDSWDCAVLKRYQVPSELLLGNETCYDYDGDHAEHDYHQA